MHNNVNQETSDDALISYRAFCYRDTNPGNNISCGVKATIGSTKATGITNGNQPFRYTATRLNAFDHSIKNLRQICGNFEAILLKRRLLEAILRQNLVENSGKSGNKN